MCGFCGILRLDGQPVDAGPLAAMNAVLHHRGPDDGHLEVDGPVALGNRRLAILDLRPEARLPMVRDALTMAYNGECYRYQDERHVLESKGQQFRTTGDTEVILALYQEHGEAFVDHLDGMYGFALWDRHRQTLYLGRDPAGKKPLYYWQDGEHLIFGSEIKAILQHPAVKREPNRAAFGLLLSHGYVPQPETCFQGIRQFAPGQLIRVRDGRLEAVRSYGTALVSDGAGGDPRPEAWVDPLLEVLRQAVQRRLISDVPLGAFLSGGIDSAIIVALMAEAMDQPVKTFSLGFAGDDSWDESSQAEETARLFGTDHTSFRVDAPVVQELLPHLVWHHDQPFGDSSAIPMLIICTLARKQVTVALTGDAGDELFAGYERFQAANLLATGWLGSGLVRPFLGLGAELAGLLPQGTGYADKGRRLKRFLDGAKRPLPLAYLQWVRIASSETVQRLLPNGAADPAEAPYLAMFAPDDQRDPVSRILDVNYRTYLHDDLLVKADRMSMAASIELRSPFLDSDVVALASRMPLAAKLEQNRTKAVLRELANKLLTPEIATRPKHGFGVPLGEWFRGGLQRYVDEVLLDPSSTGRELFDRDGLQAVLREHRDGRADHGHLLWVLLTIEHWYRLYVDPPSSRPPVRPTGELAGRFG